MVAGEEGTLILLLCHSISVSLNFDLWTCGYVIFQLLVYVCDHEPHSSILANRNLFNKY